MNKKSQIEPFFDLMGAMLILFAFLIFTYLQFGSGTKQVESLVINVGKELEIQQSLTTLLKTKIDSEDLNGISIEDLIALSVTNNLEILDTNSGILGSKYESALNNALTAKLDPKYPIWELYVQIPEKYDKSYGHTIKSTAIESKLFTNKESTITKIEIISLNAEKIYITLKIFEDQ